MKIIIIGGVAGGASAAARLRRLDENCEITMYERGEFISFANCGLPYHIGGVIEDRSELLVQTVEGMTGRFNIDIKTFHDVISIDAKNKKIKVKNINTSHIIEDSYDHLILSPGAAPVKPPIPGIDNPNIYTLRSMSDMDRIITAMSRGGREAVIVGGGFIGVEVAENMMGKGFNASIVERMDQVLTFLDPDMAAFAHQEIKSRGIKLHLSEAVVEFQAAAENKTVVILKSGRRIEADIVILAIGVAPETSLAKTAGLKIGETGAIWVDEKMRTSDPFIYAVGDATEATNFVTGNKVKIPLAGPANRQARIAANNICGVASEYKKTQGTSIVKVFDMACASTGANEAALKNSGAAYKYVVIHAGSHAGYFPHSYVVHLKLIYSPDNGRIFGAQACGYDGVDKRIDVLATAIRHNATVYDLADYELSYAPPYGSAKDPVNMAGFVAINDITKFAPVLNIFELDDHVKNGAFLLDVRTNGEVNLGKIGDACHIPLHTLRKRLDELPKDRPVIVYCKVGLRGYVAQRILKQKGFNALNLTGGYESYKNFFDQGSFDFALKSEKGSDDTQTKTVSAVGDTNVIKVNACGLACPGPLMKLREAVTKAKDNEIIEIESTDQGFYSDVQAYSNSVNLKVLNIEKGKTIKARLLKCPAASVSDGQRMAAKNEGATIVVFSDDLDRAMASCIIANGAIAMGKKVSMFFTFWGLNILRKNRAVHVEKTLIERAFGFMMPRGTNQLKLSKMNMMGMGTKMIKDIMKKNNVESLDKLLYSIKSGGGKLVARTMTMELMGIKKEELIDGVDEGGVATYLADAEKGGLNLFI